MPPEAQLFTWAQAPAFHGKPMPPRQPSDDPRLTGILDLLARGEVDEGWPAFLRAYSPLILQVVELFARDEDAVSDCFLFACTQLANRRCRRLRRFDPAGPATFSTWLHAVVYNLCRDWRRQQYPRRRAWRSISRLPAFDQEVFHLHFEREMDARETLEALRSGFPAVTEARLEASIGRLRACLSSRQLWLLATRRPRLRSLAVAAADGRENGERQIPHPGPDPEAVAGRREQMSALERTIKDLPAADALCLRLRFEQELGLAQIARVMGWKNAQEADRRLRKILGQMRRQMSEPEERKTGGRRRVSDQDR